MFEPILPMLAKIATSLPEGAEFLFEPKWDGFRAIVFRHHGGVLIQSRDAKPLDRYFPDLHEVFMSALPEGCVLDGEIVIATPRGLDFDALQQRVHPAASRVTRLAAETPASFVAFDLLALDGQDLMTRPQAERRLLLEALLAESAPPIHLTPMTTDRALALSWLQHFEGAGLDGVIAKWADQPYLPGKRAMLKVKHQRTADCVVAGFRWHKSGAGAVGSLLLGLYDDQGVLQHVGVTSSFDMATRRKLAGELQPLRDNALQGHPGPDGQMLPPPGRSSGCRERAAAGAEARISPGSPCGWSACARSDTTTCRASASATLPCSFDGASTSRPMLAATTSWKSRRRTNSLACLRWRTPPQLHDGARP